MFKYKFVAVCALFCIAVISVFFINGNSNVASPVYYQHKVLIDAGHGYPDGGAIGTKGTVESDINLDIALKLKELLEKAGFLTDMTRWDENSPASGGNKKIREIKREDLKKRREQREKSGADIFVSIHQNKFSVEKYSGAQVFYSTSDPKSERLGLCVQNALKAVLDNNNNRVAKPVKSGDIYVLDDAQIPSVLVECGFLSNKKEESLLNTDEYRKNVAWAIFCGIINYFE